MLTSKSDGIEIPVLIDNHPFLSQRSSSNQPAELFPDSELSNEGSQLIQQVGNGGQINSSACSHVSSF
jgi:hypothetical protein